MNKHNCLFIVNPTSRNPDHRVDVGYSRPHQHPLHSGDGPVEILASSPIVPPKSGISLSGRVLLQAQLFPLRLHLLLNDRQTVRVIRRHGSAVTDWGGLPIEWPVEEIDDPS